MAADDSSRSDNVQGTPSFFSFPCDDNVVDGGDGSHEDVKDKNVVSCCGIRGRMGCVAPAVPSKLVWVRRHC